MLQRNKISEKLQKQYAKEKYFLKIYIYVYNAKDRGQLSP